MLERDKRAIIKALNIKSYSKPYGYYQLEIPVGDMANNKGIRSPYRCPVGDYIKSSP